VLPEIALERPEVQALQTTDGKDNYTLSLSAGPGANIGSVHIYDGQAHVVIPSLKADFALGIATREAVGTPKLESQIVVDAKGTYAGQPVSRPPTGGHAPASGAAARQDLGSYQQQVARELLTRENAVAIIAGNPGRSEK
jgi:hypothetical protein